MTRKGHRSREAKASLPVSESTRRRRRLGRRLALSGLCLVAVVLVSLAVWPRLRVAYYCDTAVADLARGDIGSAMESLDRGETIQPSDAEVQFLFAVAHRRAGKLIAFRTRLERAARLGYSAEEIQREEWLAAIQSGQVQGLESRIEQALTEGGGGDVAEEIYEAAAKGYMATYRLNDAWTSLNAWLRMRPESPPALVLRADLRERLGDRPKAIEDYRAALNGLPGNRETRIKLGQALLRDNRAEEARSEFRECLAAAPNDVDALLGTAECVRLLGDTGEARRTLAAVLAQDLSAAQRRLAKMELGRVLLAENKPGEAVAPFREAVELAPWEAESHLFLATALARSGQPEPSRREFERVEAIRAQQARMDQISRRLIDSPNDADLRCEAGEILIAQGMAAEGVAWLMTALGCDPHHRKTHRLLADHYASAGNQQLAEHHRRLAAANK